MSFIIDGTTTTTQSLTTVTSVGVVTASGALITPGVSVTITGDGAFLVNDGLINALSFCVNATADFSLMNSGLITTESYAVNLNIADITTTDSAITNSGELVSTRSSAIVSAEAGITLQNSGLISGRSITISLGSTDDTALNRITNSGTIDTAPTTGTGTGTAILCNGTLRLANTGTIFGGLNLGDGADTIDNRAGMIFGDIDLDDGENVFLGGVLGEVVTAGAAADTLRGEGGDDDITAGAGSDRVKAGAGDDLITGGIGDDSISGGEGDDTIYGDDGADVMLGGRGSDTFIFLSPGDSDTAQPADRIEDFTRNLDLIDLSALNTAGLTFVGTGALLGGGTNSFGITKLGGVIIVRADLTGDGAVDMQFDVFGAKILAQSDFVI